MNIIIYTKANCPNCTIAKAILISKGINYMEWDVQESPSSLERLLETYPQARQMPQIFIDGQRVGGLEGLKAALKEMGL